MTFLKTCPHCDCTISLDTYPVAQVEAMQARLTELDAQNNGLRDRFDEVDTIKNAALNCLHEATRAVLQLAPLEAQAKQARDDEEWAHGQIMPVEFLPLKNGWKASVWDGEKFIITLAPTIHAALRDLRAKVEGGVR